jgi:hypothetical protein
MNLRKFEALAIGIVILCSQLIFIGLQPANAAPCVTTSSSFTGDGTTGVNGVQYNFIEFKTVSTCDWTVPSTMNADILIVGGGGGAGFGSNGGGGGAGQVVTNNSSLTLTSGAVISVTIGGGGAGGWNLDGGSWNFGQNGSTSSFGSYASAIGGGGGGGNNGSKGRDGGSGGGGAGTSANSQTLVGGNGSTSANSGWTARGFTGGTGTGHRGSGGAGAGAVGTSATASVPGTGGIGVTIFGKSVGGGGGGWTSSGSASAISFGGGSGNLPGYSVADATSQCSPSCHGAANTGGGGGGGANGGSGYIAIRYLADSTAPTITGPSSATGATSSISISENSTSVHTFTANESVTWSKSGTDGSFFSISAGGVVTITSRNFESPADSGGDNTYVVVITATDGASNATNQTLMVTITNVNEAPTISTNGSGETHAVTQAENLTTVLTYTATDVDAGSSLSFSISGTDAADFAINSSSGVLTFASSPDFEAPADSDTNNTYVVVVTVSDGALSDTQTLTVTITNANESATVSAPTVSGTINKGISTTITVTLNAAGKVRFFLGGKRISNCLARSTTGSYPNFSATCSWKPPVTGRQSLTASITPTDSSFTSATSTSTAVWVNKRANSR